MTDVNICENIAREYIPGWGESKTMAMKHARQNLVDATVLLTQIRDLDHDDDRLHMMAIEEIEKAISRIDIFHNEELDEEVN